MSLLTVKQLAEALGVSPNRIYKYLQQDIPFAKEGNEYRFNLEEVKQWIDARPRGEDQIGKDNKQSPLTQERLRLIRAQAEREEIKVAHTKGLLIKKSDVEESSLKKIAVVKAGLMSLRTQLARFEGHSLPEMEAIYDDIITNMLKEIAEK